MSKNQGVSTCGASVRKLMAKRRNCRSEVDLIYYKSDSSKKISGFKLVVHSFSFIIDYALWSDQTPGLIHKV
jgi:hypothetical protein